MVLSIKSQIGTSKTSSAEQTSIGNTYKLSLYSRTMEYSIKVEMVNQNVLRVKNKIYLSKEQSLINVSLRPQRLLHVKGV